MTREKFLWPIWGEREKRSNSHVVAHTGPCLPAGLPQWHEATPVPTTAPASSDPLASMTPGSGVCLAPWQSPPSFFMTPHHQNQRQQGPILIPTSPYRSHKAPAHLCGFHFGLTSLNLHSSSLLHCLPGGRQALASDAETRDAKSIQTTKPDAALGQLKSQEQTWTSIGFDSLIEPWLVLPVTNAVVTANEAMDVNPLEFPAHSNPSINDGQCHMWKQHGFVDETNLDSNPTFVPVYVWLSYFYLIELL